MNGNKQAWIGEAAAIKAIYEDNIRLCATVTDGLIQHLVQRVFQKPTERHDSASLYLITLQTIVCPERIVRRNQETVVYQVDLKKDLITL